MSTRNERLSPEQREAAGCLFLALSEAAELARAGERDASKLVAAMAREIGATPQARLDYAAVVDEASFEPVERIDGAGPRARRGALRRGAADRQPPAADGLKVRVGGAPPCARMARAEGGDACCSR